VNRIACVGFVALVCVSNAFATTEANPLVVGIGGAWVHSPYQGDKNRGYALPYLNYRYGDFFIDGYQAGYQVWSSQTDELDLIVRSSEHEYRPSKNHLDSMRALNKRHITMMMGGQWIHRTDFGVFKTALTGDVLDQSNGFEWNTEYHYPIVITNSVTLTPGLGVSWLSGHQANYYYGVSGAETERSTIKQYDTGNGWLPYAEVAASWVVDSHWSLSAGARYTRFSSDIKNSPMLDKSGETSIWTGIAYRF
jgi:MipA family protein